MRKPINESASAASSASAGGQLWRNLMGRGGSDGGGNDIVPHRPLPEVQSSESGTLSKLARVFEESGGGWFWATDADLKITYISHSVASRLGKDHEALIGQPLQCLFRAAEPSETPVNRTLPFVLGTHSKFAGLELAAEVDGPDCWWAVSGRPELDKTGEYVGYWGSGVDVTDSRRIQSESTQLTDADSLTGLASRYKISQRLDRALTAYKVAKRSCALIMIDLDRFKQVNDTLGHQAGDELLKQASQRLARVTKKEWDVGRLGGDEFQVILPDVDDRGQLADVAKKIIAIISQPYTIDGTRCVIGASAGVAVAPYDGITSDELTRSADLALYAAKNDGRGRYRFYSSDLHEQAEDRRQIEDDLRDALVRGEISLAYQPIVEATTNITSGFEALMRWNHPERGPVSPGIFISVAEEANLIGQLGEWALRKACEDAASWKGDARVSVNVSPIQFAHEGLPAIVASALGQSGLSPDRLELEITESIFLGDDDDNDSMFAALKKLGVRLALDDFGTGYSSLGYLQKAPFDKIKIDQSFVRGATESGNRNAAIITAIVSLADALDMETTAEGIETLDTLALIRELKVSHVQGYVYSKPMPNEEIAGRLERGELEIKPTGRAVHRSERRTLYRKIGMIHEDHRYEVTLRNISKTGAAIEGLIDVPVGTQFVADFGEGQLAVVTVKRSRGSMVGLEFEVPLISDGADGLCTRHRISPYVLAAAGMPLAALPSGQYPLVANNVNMAHKIDLPKSLPQFLQVESGRGSQRVA